MQRHCPVEIGVRRVSDWLGTRHVDWTGLWTQLLHYRIPPGSRQARPPNPTWVSTGSTTESHPGLDRLDHRSCATDPPGLDRLDHRVRTTESHRVSTSRPSTTESQPGLDRLDHRGCATESHRVSTGSTTESDHRVHLGLDRLDHRAHATRLDHRIPTGSRQARSPSMCQGVGAPRSSRKPVAQVSMSCSRTCLRIDLIRRDFSRAGACIAASIASRTPLMSCGLTR